MSSPHTFDAGAVDTAGAPLVRLRAPGPVGRALLGGVVWLAVLVPQVLLLVPDDGPDRRLLSVVIVYSAVLCAVTVRSPFTAWKAHPGQLYLLAALPALLHVAMLCLLALLLLAIGDEGASVPHEATAEDILLREPVMPWLACVAFYAAVPGITAWVASGRRRWLSAAAVTGAGVAVLCLGTLLLLVSL